MIRELLYGLVGFAVLVYSLDFVSAFFDDPREPPRLSSVIPVVGHAIGLMRNPSLYYTSTSKKTQSEMYTLSFIFIKIYITNSQRMTAVCQRAAKTLSFRPFIQTTSRTLGDVSDHVYGLFGTEMVDQFGAAMRSGLQPGPGLDAQNLRMGKRAMADVDELAAAVTTAAQGSSNGSKAAHTFPLHQWLRSLVTQASSCGIWGEQHPFVDPKAEKALWEWTSYHTLHFAGLDFLGKGFVSREIVFDAFRKYCSNIPADVSQVVLERIRVLEANGVTGDDLPKEEATFCAAIFPNTVPTLYWTFVELFSRPEVLADVRREVETNAVVRRTNEATGETEFVLDVALLKTRCPLLLSVYQETQRVRSISAMIRKVTDDTLLDGKYLLKKGNFVQMPSQPLHLSSTYWGESSETYNPYRFVSNASSDAEDKTASNSGGIVAAKFMPWGAAPHMCPARQFATTEILMTLALLAVRFELRPADGSKWDPKAPVRGGEPVTIQNPMKELLVRADLRPEGVGRWSFKMGESKTKVPLASG